jgi:hypothetical protein
LSATETNDRTADGPEEPQRASEARSSIRGQVVALLDELGDDELRVLGLLARRMLEGERVYGRMDVANDERDLEMERGEELADAAIYFGMLDLQRILRRREGQS